VSTLYQWRHQGYGPKGRRVGRYIRYDPKEVRRWFQSLDSGAMRAGKDTLPYGKH
jgi:predicted DNA-binding transcriptional regulator AlpA